MASSSDTGGARGSNIRRAYEQCQQARQLWLSVRNRTAENVPKEAAHSQLHESTLAWFEALVPYIAERPGEVKQLWESAPLWPEEPLDTDIWQCARGHEFERTEHDRPFELPGEDDEHVDLDAGGDCPECGLPVSPETREEFDDEGRRLYEWACGLKRLSAFTNKTKRVRVQGDEWSAETEIQEVPQRLDPTVLMRAARYLDLAAEECGLLEETDRALATGEL